MFSRPIDQKENCWIFPPASGAVIPRCLRKIQEEELTVTMLLPVAESTMVAPGMAHVLRLAIDPTPPPSNINELGGGKAPRVAPILAFDRSAAIRLRFAQDGIQPPAVKLWFDKLKEGENGKTNRNLDSVWNKYATWVCDRNGDPFHFNVSHITQYLTDVLIGERKLGAGSCNTFLSMCSETHPVWFPNSPKLADSPMIIRIREGLAKQHGTTNVKAKPATYFSLFSLFTHLATMSHDDNTCELRVLRDKLITLMLIDCMARSSDLTTITREAITCDEKGAQFNFFYTKEAKAPGEILSYLRACPANPLICTVTVLRQYLRRTAALRIEPIMQKVNGISVQRTPLLISDFATQGLYKPLGSDRISNTAKAALQAIGVTVWKTHAIRGASSSKVVNLIPARRPEVCIRARWANETTFMKSYFKACQYNQANQAELREWSLERILRYQATRVGS